MQALAEPWILPFAGELSTALFHRMTIRQTPPFP
jgi:hypothetical protein